jgi:hypothetical protein
MVVVGVRQIIRREPLRIAKRHLLAKAPRCLAMNLKGTECHSPAEKVRKRCSMHGGTNPGAPKGNRNAREHGTRSAEAKHAAVLINQPRSTALLAGNNMCTGSSNMTEWTLQASHSGPANLNSTPEPHNFFNNLGIR